MSNVFAAIWDKIEELRVAKGLSEEKCAERNGFVRSTWFSYKKHGTIPFSLLEKVADSLDARVQASVMTGMSEGAATSSGTRTEETMPDYLRRIAEELEKLPEEDRSFVAGVVVSAIREEAKRPSEPVAGHERASRGRSSKS